MENNKLIAEFLGWELSERARKFNIHDIYPYGYVKANPNFLYFDKSWDWIIPAVQRCEDTNELAYKGSNIKSALLSLDVQNVFNAVVEFIKYHNDVRNRPFIPNLEYKDGFGNWYDYTEELQKDKSFNPFKTREKI